MANKVSDRLVEAMPLLDQIADKMAKAYEPFLGPDAPRGLRDALYGTWLGHPLHPAVVLLPLGFWSSTLVLDAVGEEQAADLTLKLGFVSALGAAATGAAQWQDTTSLDKPRRLGTLHAVLNVIATMLYGGSWLLRNRGSRGAGIALSTTGYGLSAFSAWLGGDLAYDLGIGVKRTAFEDPPTEWRTVLPLDDLAENEPRRVDLDGIPVMLVRQGNEIFAISATCNHIGGPLDEGTIDGETVTCPWHASVFHLRDGGLIHGPATSPQPAYEVRVQDGQIALRALEE